MDPKSITDQKVMEEFFKKNLKKIVKEESELVALTVMPYNEKQIFDPTTKLAEYKLTIKSLKKTFSVHLRGSAERGKRREKHFNIITSLREQGFDCEPYEVVSPVGYFEELNLLLYYNITGQSLYDKFKWVDRKEWEQKIWDATSWLIAFHNKKINTASIPGLKIGLEEERHRFKKMFARLTKKFPANGEILNIIGKKIDKDEKRLLDPQKFVLVHGDYQPNNIIFTDDPYKTVAIDFNDSMLCDELFDLGTFLAQTKEMVWRVKNLEIEQLLKQVEGHYLQKRNIKPSNNTMDKIKLFKTKALLHIKSVSDAEQSKRILHEIKAY